MSGYIPNQTIWLNNATSATNNLAIGFQPFVATPQLPSVADRASEWAYDRDAKLSPLEWLERQVGDVCRLAAVA